MDVSGDMLFESILYLHDTYIATFAAFAALRYLHRRFGCQDPSCSLSRRSARTAPLGRQQRQVRVNLRIVEEGTEAAEDAWAELGGPEEVLGCKEGLKRKIIEKIVSYVLVVLTFL